MLIKTPAGLSAIWCMPDLECKVFMMEFPRFSTGLFTLTRFVMLQNKNIKLFDWCILGYGQIGIEWKYLASNIILKILRICEKYFQLYMNQSHVFNDFSLISQIVIQFLEINGALAYV